MWPNGAPTCAARYELQAWERRSALPVGPHTAGDFTVRMPHDWSGIDGKIAEAVEYIAATHDKLAAAVDRVSHTVGIEGKLAQRLVFDKTDGAWRGEVDAINSMIDILVQPVREVGRVIGAVTRGILAESTQLEIEGRPLRGSAT